MPGGGLGGLPIGNGCGPKAGGSGLMMILVVVVLFVVMSRGCGGIDLGGGGGTGGGGGVGPRTELIATEAVTRDDMSAADRQQMDQSALDARDDVNEYWEDVFDDVWPSGQYSPPSGGAFPFDPANDSGLSCGQSLPNNLLENNAIYCPPEDYITWDSRYLFPKLSENFGAAAPAVVMAHEWGHMVQSKAGVEGPTIVKELQADCLAGAWVNSIQADESERVTPFSGDELDGSVAGFLLLRDPPGLDPLSQGAHGSGFDRVLAYEDGLINGPSTCATYNEQNVLARVVDLEFAPEDQSTGGNLPYQEALDVTLRGLSEYWAPEIQSEFGDQLGLDEYQSSRGGRPSCPNTSQEEGGPIFWCTDTGSISFDQDTLAKVHADIGDFALALLFAREYGQAVLDIERVRGTETELDIASHCLAGVWARAVYDGNLQIGTDTDGTPLFLDLSAGDLDEAMAVMLRYRNPRFDATLFARTNAFRDGFMEGEAACT
ncbi:MAG: neutral zinc metallopeptidase [Acidimicrobiales bacterium]